ncbi:MAG: hypothetical protein IJI46_05525 [Erysipelotrichaceae bacterium]|nr:hypothetical protein [Erysipelotrichaceae bacterium]
MGKDTTLSTGSLFHIKTLFDYTPIVKTLQSEELKFAIKAEDEGQIVSYASRGYRYGPSIMQHEDGSYDAWFSSPGNNSTQWDWIRYRHSDDGVNWSKEQIVLKPTSGSKDRCSVCDPGVFYYDGYYYLGYTSTDDYVRDGYNNSAFVARSVNPDGPFEKWNGEGWGGKPEPIIKYDGDPDGWGIGEPSFVIVEDKLYIYYTHFDLTGGYTGVAVAQLGENWPASIENKGMVMGRTTQDSMDVFYEDELELFMGFSIENKMSEGSRVALYVSKNGMLFEKYDDSDTYIEDYAHSMGIAKDEQGHQSIEDPLLFGYAYGKGWGRWNMKFQYLSISNLSTYKVVSK